MCKLIISTILKNSLIFEDEEKLRGLLARIVKSEGFEVFEASDLKSGFKKMEIMDIDIVLCDVKLPDGTGVDFLQKIKSAFPLTEVIFVNRLWQNFRWCSSHEKRDF